MSDERIVRHTLAELVRLPDQSDWMRVDAMTEEEIEANALADSDNPPLSDVELAQMAPKRPLISSTDHAITIDQPNA